MKKALLSSLIKEQKLRAIERIINIKEKEIVSYLKLFELGFRRII